MDSLKHTSRIVAPSLLSADFSHLSQAVEMVNQSEAQWLHLDIMDGVFVPNISYGFPVIKDVQPITSCVLDAHLMIVEPDRYLERFAEVGVGVLTVHYEACTHLQRTLSTIRQLGMKAGVAINPHTPPELLRDVLENLDLVLIMSVNPGFGGQKFIPRTLDRIRRLALMVEEGNHSILIEVDGGVSPANASILWAAGADVLVAGSAIFQAQDPKRAIQDILHA